MRWSADYFVKCDLDVAKYNFYQAQENGMMELFMFGQEYLPEEIGDRLLKQISLVVRKQELFCTGIR